MANKSHKAFMPLLCRFAQTDTVEPAKLPARADPSSPKLTCIGQMKKKSTSTTNHRFLAGNPKSSAHSNRYKLFSGKTLISPVNIDANNKSVMNINSVTNRKSVTNSNSVTNGNSVTNRSKSCNGIGRIPIIRAKKYYMTSSDDHDIMRVMVDENLDPPLPVVKCGRRDTEMNVNLWKRRGIEIQTLEIQAIQLNANNRNSSRCNNGGFLLPSTF